MQRFDEEIQIPVSMIYTHDNMYQKITRMFQFIFHYCEEQEHELQETSLVTIDLVEINENEGQIQINVDGPWLKKFKIRLFLNEILMHERLNFDMYYGNKEKSAYYLYNITWNEEIRRTETELHRQESSIFEKIQYLQINIKTTIAVVKSVFNKIRNYLKSAAPKYPNVEIQFNAAGYSLKDEDLDDKFLHMITESISDVIKYGTKYEFRKSVFEMFNCNSKEWACNEIYHQLCNFIPEN